MNVTGKWIKDTVDECCSMEIMIRVIEYLRACSREINEKRDIADRFDGVYNAADCLRGIILGVPNDITIPDQATGSKIWLDLYTDQFPASTNNCQAVMQCALALWRSYNLAEYIKNRFYGLFYPINEWKFAADSQSKETYEYNELAGIAFLNSRVPFASNAQKEVLFARARQDRRFWRNMMGEAQRRAYCDPEYYGETFDICNYAVGAGGFMDMISSKDFDTRLSLNN